MTSAATGSSRDRHYPKQKLDDASRRLRTRSLAAQQAETRIGIHVLNRMLDLGRPITQPLA